MNNYYNSYPYGTGQNFYTRGQQQFAPQIMEQRQTPFQNVLFLNGDEIKGRVVFPNTTDLLIDRENHVAYVKSADQMGLSTTKAYRLEEIIEEDKNSANKGNTMANIDMSNYVGIKEFNETIKNLEEKVKMLTEKLKGERHEQSNANFNATNE